jgi:hypothetical protein
MATTEQPLRHPARDPTQCELAPISTVSLSNLEYSYGCDTMNRSRRAGQAAEEAPWPTRTRAEGAARRLLLRA